MTVVPAPPGLVHRHVVASAVRGLIDAVDGAPVGESQGIGAIGMPGSDGHERRNRPRVAQREKAARGLPIAGLVARPDDAHAVAQVACQLDALDAAALADCEARMMAGPEPSPKIHGRVGRHGGHSL